MSSLIAFIVLLLAALLIAGASKVSYEQGKKLDALGWLCASGFLFLIALGVFLA
jgi:hypothetical protein